MKHFLIALSLLTLLLPVAAFSSEYDAFSKDLIKPYGLFKKSLSLTSKKEDIDRAKDTVRQFISAWDGFSARYDRDAPGPFASLEGFSAGIRRPVEIGKSALSFLEAGDTAKAHSVLEEIRYILWDMRVKSGIVSLTDKINDFHEAMEIVIEKIDHAKDSREVAAVYERYSAWLAIKWEEIALAKDFGTEEKTYNEALKEGRAAISRLNEALKTGNKETASKLSTAVKNSYKKLFFMPV